jgi:hypothetical protein
MLRGRLVACQYRGASVVIQVVIVGSSAKGLKPAIVLSGAREGYAYLRGRSLQNADMLSAAVETANGVMSNNREHRKPIEMVVRKKRKPPANLDSMSSELVMVHMTMCLIVNGYQPVHVAYNLFQ